jgi:hypothetical protein
MKNCIFLTSVFFLLIRGIAAQELPAEITTDAEVPDESLAVPEAEKPIEIPSPEVLASPLKISFPDEPAWNKVQEGQEIKFCVKASGGTDSIYSYFLPQGWVEGMQFDSLGMFSWIPGFDFVDRLSSDTTIQLIFEVRNESSERVSSLVELQVEHVNRAPVVGELKPFYVGYNSLNTYTIESSVLKDEDGDPVVFVPIMDAMPEGARLSEQGVFTWKPSYTQFNRLRNQPIMLEFYLEDQPAKARSKGHFTIKATQQDLPPSIQMIPYQQHFQYKEDATLSLKFQLHDPNGEDDITSFSLISDNPEVPAAALVKNTPTQYEFIWKPGYDFVKDPQDSLSFNITFFVLDKANLKEERTVSFTILNAVNEEERDQRLYTEYRATLLRAWDLMEQLKEAEKDLKKKYRKARRGKRNRSLTNASLGAATGITPVVVEEPATSKKITAIGGTAVMTIGTLEATEVFGRSAKDLIERLNYIIEKRNELQTKGDIFARKYALKSSRQRNEFMKDVDELIVVMNLKGLVALELDAGWKNKAKFSDENISKTFKDFNPEK